MDLEHILRNIEALESEIQSSERYALLSAAGLFAVLLLQIDHAFLDFFWFLPAFVVVLFLLRVTMLRSRQAELREMFPPEFKLHQPRRGSLFVFLGVLLAVTLAAGVYARMVNDALTSDEADETVQKASL